MVDGNSNSAAWVGKYRILVKRETDGPRSDWFVVDLKRNMIVIKNPQPVWGENLQSTALLHEEEGTLSVLNIGVNKFDATSHHIFTFQIALNEQEDYIHSSSSSNTCTSTLDFTKDPPLWSKWTPGPKINFDNYELSYAILHNQLITFQPHHNHDDDDDDDDDDDVKPGLRSFNDPDVYQIGSSDYKRHDDDDVVEPVLRSFNDPDIYQIGGSSDYKLPPWEMITIPLSSGSILNDSGWPSIQPISDPNNNRLIVYFHSYNKGDSLYAYYPNKYHPEKNEQWILLRQNLSHGYLLEQADTFANQLVGDKFILGYNSFDRFIIAYNISTHEWLEVDSLFKSDDPNKMYFDDESKLVHLGDDIFCLANFYLVYPKQIVLKFQRFSVKCVEGERLQLTPLTFHHISIDDIICMVDTYIPF